MLDLPKVPMRLSKVTLPSGGTLMEGGPYTPKLHVLDKKQLPLFDKPPRCEHQWLAIGHPLMSRESKCARCGAVG